MAATPEAPEQTSETTASPLDSHAAPVADRRGHSGLATAALVLGLVGLPLAILFWPIGLVLGILAIVLGAIARSDARKAGATNTGQAMAGIILGSVDIVLVIALIAVAATIVHNNNS